MRRLHNPLGRTSHALTRHHLPFYRSSLTTTLPRLTTALPRHSTLLHDPSLTITLPTIRHASTTSNPPQPLPHRPAPHRNPNEPAYELTFTCKACEHRSAHTVSKQGYHKGTVLITCPGCKSRHLISDHLHIFSDTAVTLEDILAMKGEALQKGSIDAQGDIEFWTQSAVDRAGNEAGERKKKTDEDQGGK